MNGARCEATRPPRQCPNKPWRVIDVTFHGNRLASYAFCRKHYGMLVSDGKVKAA